MEHHESERTTRKERIDPRLTVAGWTIVGAGDPPVECAAAVEEYSTANGPADYALAEGGRILGLALISRRPYVSSPAPVRLSSCVARGPEPRPNTAPTP